METNYATTAPGKPFNRFEIPIKIGLLIAILKVIFSTIQFQFFISSFGMNAAISFVSFLTGVVLLCYIGIQQRKAMGGYITFKEAFSAMFIAILIVVCVTYFYDLIYMKWIDPSAVEKMKDASLSFAQRFGAPQETLDEMAEKFDAEQSGKNSIGSQVLSFLTVIVWNSIIGFICAAIVKKKKPEIFA